MAFWPGDEVRPEEDAAEYEARKKKRSEKVISFISSDTFAPLLVRSVATCKPRWTFARNINPRSPDSKKTRVGAPNALSTIIADYRNVFNCTDISANYVVDKLADAAFHRMSVCAAIFRSLLYLAGKNKPFTADVWKALRGETQCGDYARTVRNASCCADTGCAYKLSQALSSLPGGTPQRAIEETMIVICLERLSREICRKGGVDATIVERLFSITRALGLRHGYRLKFTEYQPFFSLA